MPKEETFIVTGQIIDCMPNATFKVKLDDNDSVITGLISGKIRKYNINILLGDKVDIELTPYDITKGRIVYRHK